MSCLERKNSDLSMMALKKDYHESLKTINHLKTTQQETEKELALLHRQLQADKDHHKQQQQEWALTESRYLRQVEEVNAKAKHKSEELANTLKQYRQENTELLC